MKIIKLIKGTGYGKTKLGAFDNALHNCGVHNHNLIYLSSVIPSGQCVQVVDKFEDSKRWGSKLYVVMASHTTDTRSEATIGYLFDEETGNGLFVEHGELSATELCKDALDDLAKTRNIVNYSTDFVETIVEAKEGEFACAMVVAVFEEEDWKEV